MIKSNNIFFILVILISGVAFSQITPITTQTDTNKTIYFTNSFNQSLLNFRNQSYDLKEKIQDKININDNIDPLSVKNCLSSTTYSSLRSNKIIFIIEYICDQNGNTLACKLINYGNSVQLSSSEVQCILTEAMSTTFNFSNVPNDLSSFYILIDKSYKFK